MKYIGTSWLQCNVQSLRAQQIEMIFLKGMALLREEGTEGDGKS